MSDPWRLVASYFTLAGNVVPFSGTNPSPFDLRDRAVAAAAAGYVGFGVETSDLIHCVERFGHAGIKAILRDAGLDYFELECLFDWFAQGEARAASDRSREIILRAAGEIGVVQIKAVAASRETQCSRARMIDEFATLCREAAAVGANLNLEIYPDSHVRDLEAAQAVVGGANEPNGGLLIDIWHMGRGGVVYEDLAKLPPGMIKAVELDDAKAEQIGSIFEDTIHRRLLPGEGDLDVQRFLDCIHDTGFDGVYGVEIVSDAHRQLSLAEAARRSFDATNAQLKMAAERRASQAASALAG